ncbi:efflux RND transporter periplasmic adaptor subunit [Parabacteroides sp. PF5-9]|uniref:efflux RND transporter periplasmic adaptor subunit n=1 Tax=Parabacteroides sp. PF5-9 TaxID=1742404 RepID=UPI0024735132|nr:efflux RND transporter periplasmic adaptor subunit [Parabacteroides sp. PF5-9]MDH6357839.1 RND family efflux transporter MFP subunit [Parabacteroides sp. PF5-9]
MKYYNLLAFIFLALFVSCGDSKEKNTEEDSIETILPEETTRVTVMTLKEADFNHELISNGRLSARQYVDLHFESAEPIAKIYVKNGDRVSKGQKLAELAAFRLNNKTVQAKDALERARLELQDVLIGQGYMLEDSAKVPAATMQLVRTKSGYDGALIQYQLARHEEEQAILTAPFDGVVANLFTKEQNIASPSDLFCTVINPNSLEAAFTVLESELPLIKTGDRVEVSPFAATEIKTEGRITEINPVVDVNGMVQVKAAVNSKGNLFEGMNVRVSVQRALGNQLVVPKAAVVLRSGKQVVFTLVNGKSYWNYVQTGLENAEHFTVTEGLKDGDIVITSGNINLAHESSVVVNETEDSN